MVSLVLTKNNSYGNYTKIDKEDPLEKSHREAQFLIYKAMKEIDQIAIKKSSKTSWLKLRICKLKVKIGKKLLRLRKTMLICNMSKTKVGLYKHVMGHLRSFKRLFNGVGRHGGGGSKIRHLPQPLFIC